MTLRDYLGIAYRTKISNIAGPDWIASDRFDISATIPEGNKPAQIPEMFQALLAERFHLKIHREKRDFPVYALIIGKGELKLKEVPPDDDKGKTAEPINASGGGSVVRTQPVRGQKAQHGRLRREPRAIRGPADS
jgi:uncharacterized protein (TIGR03435 family)